MKIMTVAEVKNTLSEYLKLEHDPRFRAKIETRWRRYLRTGGVALEQLIKRATMR